MRLGSTKTNKGHGKIQIQLGVSTGRVGFGVDPTTYATGSGEWTIDPLSTKCSGQSQLFGSLIEQVEIVKWFLVWRTTQKNQRTQHKLKEVKNTETEWEMKWHTTTIQRPMRLKRRSEIKLHRDQKPKDLWNEIEKDRKTQKRDWKSNLREIDQLVKEVRRQPCNSRP